MFRWVSNREEPEVTYWGVNEPDDRYNGEDCAALHVQADGNNFWFDGRCEDTHRNFVCEAQ